MNLAVFISGRGSNLKALLDAQGEGYFPSEIKLVVSNKEAEGLDYARDTGIDYLVSKDDAEIIRTMKEKNIDLVVLAGYLPKISKDLIDNFTLINIHPSLLPKYGGKGYYGMNVHRAVFENGEKTSGVTVHYVNEKLDDGKIILQREVDISGCESAEEVADEVLVVEHEILKDAIKLLEEK
ncbi:MAG: phosphoribosylglycinamide formyltransferase [Peptoniphilaceae bacterium]|nr:phosphoribosylglycinamide formyltransferase [Anaerococcus sp.]MDD7044066.1 phosphoribosylglycinamide formyltransferase [Peptoniphilaceae bacterium]